MSVVTRYLKVVKGYLKENAFHDRGVVARFGQTVTGTTEIVN